MPEEIDKNAAADQGDGAGEGAGAKNDAGTGDNGNGADNGKGADDAGGAGKSGADADKSKADAEAAAKAAEAAKANETIEPATQKRKTAKDFIIERQKAKIEKMNAKKAAAGEDAGAGDDEEADVDEEEDADDTSAEDEKLISKTVSKQLAPIIEKHLDAEDVMEIQSFIKENPDFSPYEAKVKAYMKHPSRRALPVKSIFYEVAGDDLMKIGARRQKEADEKAKNSQAGGGSDRGGGTSKSPWEMSKAEFEAQQNKVRNGG